MKTSVFLWLSFFVLVANTLAAQDPSMDEMLDDGVSGSERLILKTNPFTMLNGDFPIYAELKLLPKISIEAGVGFQAGYFLNELPYYLFDENVGPFTLESGESLEVSSGYSLRILPRYYIIGGNLEGFYVGPFWRKRQFGIKNAEGKATHTDICLTFGQQHNLHGRFFFDYYLGLGFRKETLPEGLVSDRLGRTMIFPWGIKVGYGF